MSCSRATPQKLTIATASNMQFAMAELSQAFSASTRIPCQPVISSSGKLTAQIQAGAPFDVFLSADLKYPNLLYQNQLTQGKPQIYAYGTLVLWTMKPNLLPSLEILGSSQVDHISIANPKTAPYGHAALESLQSSLKYDQPIQQKLIYGESIAQVNQFISTQVAEIGFTAKSTVVSSPLANQGQWIEVESKYYNPIAQGIVIIKNNREQLPQAKRFQAFLFSKQGQSILKKHGYLINKP